MPGATQPDRIDEAFARGMPITNAIRMGLADAFREPRRAGRSVVVWCDGQVVEIEGEEIDRAIELSERLAREQSP